MNPTLFSPLILNLFILILFLLSYNSIEAIDKFYETCTVPKTCGDNQNITFPFYIQGVQEPFCGYPGFQLSCNNNGHPILNFSNENYIIHKIFYQNQSLIVSNSALSNPQTNCIPFAQNLTLVADDLQLVPNQSRVFLLYNCNSSLVKDFPKNNDIGCSIENRTRRIVGLSEKDLTQMGNNVSKCGKENLVVAPVMRNNIGDDENEINIREILSRGFLMKWTASDCSVCEWSGGRCGFDSLNYLFKCYCPDRPRYARCDSLQNGHGRKLWIAIGHGRKLWIAIGHGRKLWIAIGIIGFGAIVMVLVLVLFLLRKKLMPNNSEIHKNMEAYISKYGPLPIRRYNYVKVKKMTNNFTTKLGQGGYGAVYKGKLENGCLVAVKMLNESKGNGEEFMNEVATISRTSHINIVSLWGFCIEGSKRALIYEFMPNGSLEKFIFDGSSQNNNNPKLEWEMLYQIALGIARGLEYLHRGCSTRILHFDIKPHNILLDKDMSPKISDFGLAKICTRDDSIVSILGTRGTVGYIAPEVFSRNFGGVSHKSDVYSYGMMVFEMVGGRKNINVNADQTSEIYFPDWIYKRLELGLELGLLRILNEDENQKAKKMIIVSLWCIQPNPSNRPTIGQVIDMLEGSLESLQLPPKPVLFTPSREPAHIDSTTLLSY